MRASTSQRVRSYYNTSVRFLSLLFAISPEHLYCEYTRPQAAVRLRDARTSSVRAGGLGTCVCQ